MKDRDQLNPARKRIWGETEAASRVMSDEESAELQKVLDEEEARERQKKNEGQ
jgi:hypothetical protein